MRNGYEEDLLSPDITWDAMTLKHKVPLKLYKYQSFTTEKGTENPYWAGNMTGQFHLSLGCEFEDRNDCKPFFDRKFVLDYLNNFFISFNSDEQSRFRILSQVNSILTDEYFADVMKKYQSCIRIGCFTDSSSNEKMWNKYACLKKGYCIEYNTEKNMLFQLSTLPVLYSNKPYNSSLTLASSLVLECNKSAKKYSEEESINIFGTIYEKILKTAYIPVFIKQKEVWEFEREYRLFLLKNRNTRDGILKMKDILDKNYNVDLSRAVNAIYLGEDFDKNENCVELLNKVISVCQANKIDLFRKLKRNGSVIDFQIT